MRPVIGRGEGIGGRDEDADVGEVRRGLVRPKIGWEAQPAEERRGVGGVVELTIHPVARAVMRPETPQVDLRRLRTICSSWVPGAKRNPKRRPVATFLERLAK